MPDNANFSSVPCPVCGSKNIGVKDNIVTTQDKRLVRKVWRYCRRCFYNGSAFLYTGDNQDKEIKEAYKRWSEAKNE